MPRLQVHSQVWSHGGDSPSMLLSFIGVSFSPLPLFFPHSLKAMKKKCPPVRINYLPIYSYISTSNLYLYLSLYLCLQLHLHLCLYLPRHASCQNCCKRRCKQTLACSDRTDWEDIYRLCCMNVIYMLWNKNMSHLVCVIWWYHAKSWDRLGLRAQKETSLGKLALAPTLLAYLGGRIGKESFDLSTSQFILLQNGN